VRLIERDKKQHAVQQHRASVLVQIVRSLVTAPLWPEGFQANTPKEVLFVHEVGGDVM
jgi:hypothetical protein